MARREAQLYITNEFPECLGADAVITPSKHKEEDCEYCTDPKYRRDSVGTPVVVWIVLAVIVILIVYGITS